MLISPPIPQRSISRGPPQLVPGSLPHRPLLDLSYITQPTSILPSPFPSAPSSPIHAPIRINPGDRGDDVASTRLAPLVSSELFDHFDDTPMVIDPSTRSATTTTTANPTSCVPPSPPPLASYAQYLTGTPPGLPSSRTIPPPPIHYINSTMPIERYSDSVTSPPPSPPPQSHPTNRGKRPRHAATTQQNLLPSVPNAPENAPQCYQRPTNPPKSTPYAATHCRKYNFWCATWYDFDTIPSIQAFVDHAMSTIIDGESRSMCKALIFSLEIGTAKQRPHFQCYFEFYKPVALRTLRSNFASHARHTTNLATILERLRAITEAKGLNPDEYQTGTIDNLEFDDDDEVQDGDPPVMESDQGDKVPDNHKDQTGIFWNFRQKNHAAAYLYCKKDKTRLFGPITEGNFTEGVPIPGPPPKRKRTRRQTFNEGMAALQQEGGNGDEAEEMDRESYLRLSHRDPGLADLHKLEMVRLYAKGKTPAQLVGKLALAFANNPLQCYFMSGQHRNFKTKVIVIQGSTGTGKTNWAFTTYPDAFFAPPVTRAGVQWMDGYMGQETVIIDEYTGGVRWDELLRMLDKYPLSAQVKGSYVKFTPKTIVITTNVNPDAWYPTMKSQFPTLRRRITEAYKMVIDPGATYIDDLGRTRQAYKRQLVPEWCDPADAAESDRFIREQNETHDGSVNPSIEEHQPTLPPNVFMAVSRR